MDSAVRHFCDPKYINYERSKVMDKLCVTDSLVGAYTFFKLKDGILYAPQVGRT